MAVRKEPNMSKPKNPAKGATTGKLMDNQDRINRGDGEDVQKVPTTILLPTDLKEQARQYAKSRGTTLTYLITEGLYMAMEAKI